METEKTETVPTYSCTCNGCRQSPKDLHGIYTWEQIPDRTNGHYFDAATRRFFSSRILSWRPLGNGALAVRESSAGDMDNTYRVHRVVVFCKFGELFHRSENFRTGTAARDHMRGLADNFAAACDCHGCTIERAKAGN